MNVGIRGLAGFLLGLFVQFAMAQDERNMQGVAGLTHEGFVTSDQVRLCYVAHLLDDPSAPLLVFVPGWTMPAAIWEKQLAHFAGKYSVVAFDPRGQGESAIAASGYTLERRSRDLKELLDRFPERSFILVSWSLAVLESIAYIERFDDVRLKGVILVDNSIGEGPDGLPPSGENPFFTELRTQREATLRDFVTAIFHGEPDAAFKDKILASALRIDVEDSIRLLSYGKPRAYWRETLYAFAKPVLYLVTSRWEAQAQLLAEKHPKASVRVFPEAGHALFWDADVAFNQAIEDFVVGLGTR